MGRNARIQNARVLGFSEDEDMNRFVIYKAKTVNVSETKQQKNKRNGI